MFHDLNLDESRQNEDNDMPQILNLDHEILIFNKTYKSVIKDVIRLNEFHSSYNEDKKNFNIRINDRVRKNDLDNRIKDLETRIFQKVSIFF